MSDDMLDTLRLNSVFKFIGHVDDIQNIDKNAEFSVGDIMYSEANRAPYVYTDNGEFVRLESTCNDDTDSALKMKPHPTNCVNCGAVLTGYTCKYCGTDYPRY